MTPRVPRRALGETGIDVPVLGLGTVRFGRTEGLRHPTRRPLPSDAEVLALLDTALACGVDLLDTAPAYGESEARLGRLLGARRDDFTLVSKAGEQFENGRSRHDFSTPALRASVESSLRRLATDHLDCLLLHSDGRDETILRETDAVETLVRLKDAGQLRSHGMSTKSVAGGLAALDAGLDVVMITLSRSAPEEAEVARAATALQRGVLVKKALASGHAVQDVPGDLRWVAAQTGVTSVVLGTLDVGHLETAVRALAS